ncbi:TPA: FidL-like protein [Salmonella enterica]
MRYFKEYLFKTRHVIISVIILLAFSIIILYFTLNSSREDDLNFSCSASFSNIYKIKDDIYRAKGVFFVTGFSNGRFYMAVQGSLNTDEKTYIMNRKMLFSYFRPDVDSEGTYTIKLLDADKNELDTTPDALMNNILGTYHRMGSTYLINDIDDKTVLIKSIYSPKFICIRQN